MENEIHKYPLVKGDIYTINDAVYTVKGFYGSSDAGSFHTKDSLVLKDNAIECHGDITVVPIKGKHHHWRKCRLILQT